MSADNITDLLNKVSAIVKSGASSFPLLAQETNIPVKAIYDIMGRRHDPNGPRTAALMQWAATKTIQISMASREIQNRYRSEYVRACKRFPVNGKD